MPALMHSDEIYRHHLVWVAECHVIWVAPHRTSYSAERWEDIPKWVPKPDNGSNPIGMILKFGFAARIMTAPELRSSHGVPR